LPTQYIGVVGGPMFVGRNIRFDFPNSNIQILPSDFNPTDMGGKLYPESPSKSRIELDVIIDGTSVHAMFDTHAPCTEFDPGLLAKHPKWFKFVGNSSGTDVIGNVKQFQFYKLNFPVCMDSTCRAGSDDGYMVTKVAEDFGNGPIEMVLGADFLFQGAWSIAYTSGKYFVQFPKQN
jgi:hypothetical protein